MYWSGVLLVIAFPVEREIILYAGRSGVWCMVYGRRNSMGKCLSRDKANKRRMPVSSISECECAYACACACGRAKSALGGGLQVQSNFSFKFMVNT